MNKKALLIIGTVVLVFVFALVNLFLTLTKPEFQSDPKNLPIAIGMVVAMGALLVATIVTAIKDSRKSKSDDDDNDDDDDDDE